MCYLTAEIPYPVTASEQADINRMDLGTGHILGFRPLILRAPVMAVGGDDRPAHAFIQPDRVTVIDLSRILNTLRSMNASERILVRLTLKGNFIFRDSDANRVRGWLHGDAFTDPAKGQLMLPSGDGRRGGDFEMWFWLTTERVVDRTSKPSTAAKKAKRK